MVHSCLELAQVNILFLRDDLFMNFPYEHAFLGLGNMAEAILASMLKVAKTDPKQIIVCRRNTAKLKKQAKQWRVPSTKQVKEAASQSQYIWLGVKPQQAQELLSEIASNINKSQIIISMMAGISIKTIKQAINANCTVIRIMPNTPAMLGHGAIGAYFPKNLQANIKNKIKKILQGMGKLEILSQEKLLDAVTGLSGSGPAFIYQIAQAMIQGAMNEGLTQKQAKSLCIQTLLGASKMLELTKKTPEQLSQAVTSKGGTTEAGLKILAKHKVFKSITLAVEQAIQRAQILRSENETCLF